MTDYVIDPCTGTSWQPFTAHTPTLGGPCVNHPDETGDFYCVSNRAVCRSAPALVYYQANPANANYKVEASIVVLTSDSSSGVAGRIDTSDRTYYTAYIEATTNKVILAKRVAGVITSLGVSAAAYGVGTHLLALDMNGTTIRALIGGVQVLSVTDSSITAAGKGGIRGVTTSDVGIGKHIDNVKVYDALVASSPKSYAVLVGL